MDLIINISVAILTWLIFVGCYIKMRDHEHFKVFLLAVLVYGLGHWHGSEYPLGGGFLPESGEGLFWLGFGMLLSAVVKNLNPQAFSTGGSK